MPRLTELPLRSVTSGEDLRTLAKSLGIADAIDAQELSCAFSDDLVSWLTLFSIFPDNDKVQVACRRPACVKRFAVFAQSTGLY